MPANGGYYTAQMCLNGHVITHALERKPESASDHCQHCGAGTITDCPECKAKIRGGLVDRPTLDYKAPGFCYSCGNPYPWTLARLEAAKELISLQPDLSEQDKRAMDNSIDEIVKDTPRTIVEASKLKIAISKVGVVVGQGLRDILVDVASETAKKIIWPGK